jgi:acyl-coenzyme A synthetase/AMP-(fatty) acid ligase
MKLTLTKEEMHYLVRKHFEEEHKIYIGAIYWNTEDGTAMIDTISPEQAEKEKDTLLERGWTIKKLSLDIDSCKVNNQKITAIKMFREATNKGLKEAKDFVDNYFATGKWSADAFK